MAAITPYQHAAASSSQPQNPLLEALAKNEDGTSLDLSRQSITDDMIESLASTLLGNSSLTSLDLSRNDLTAAHIRSLAPALIANSKLTSLNLEVNPLGVEGAAVLATILKSNTSLESLHLWLTQLGTAGMAALAEGLMSNSSLTFLDLNRNQITDEGLKTLALGLIGNSGLTSLDLSNNELKNEGILGLASNTSLISLNLGHNEISSASALLACSNIKSLDLRNNKISDIEATAIAQRLITNSTLTSIDLANNLISDEGVAALSQALRVNSSLRSFSISGLTATGVETFALALEDNPSLTEFFYNIRGDVPEPLIRQVRDCTLRNLEMFEKRNGRLSLLCYRELYKRYFNDHLDDVSRNKAYNAISLMFGCLCPEEESLEFGKHNIFRIWSMFEMSLRTAGIGMDFYSKAVDSPAIEYFLIQQRVRKKTKGFEICQ